MDSGATPRVVTGFPLLADISGYTAFLEAVAVAHPEMAGTGDEVPPAYGIMGNLLHVVVENIAPTFELAEIEGDAVFGYALDDRMSGGGGALLAIVRSAYDAFRAQIGDGMRLRKDDCDACMLLPSLELKFVVHHGTLVIQPIAGRERLLGPVVNAAHRLLKNSVTERTGRRAYLFVSGAAAARLELKPDLGEAHEERYADVGAVTGLVIGLGS